MRSFNPKAKYNFEADSNSSVYGILAVPNNTKREKFIIVVFF